MLKAMPTVSRPTANIPGIKRSVWLTYSAVLIFSFLLAKAAIMGELYPFGTSFLAAVSVVQRKQSKAVLLGTLLGIGVTVEGATAAAYLICAVLLYAVLYRYSKSDRHWLVLPGLVAAVHLLIRGAVVYITGNETYLWVGVVFESFFAAILTMVAVTALLSYPKAFRKQELTPEERTSLGLIILGGLLGIGGFELWNTGFQSIISRWLVMCGAYYGGPGGGASIGVIVGIVPGIQGTLTTGPIAFYALSGLLGGFFNNFRKIGVVIGFTLANLMLSLFFSEQVVIINTLRETGIAVVCFLLLPVHLMTTQMADENQSGKQEKSEIIADRLKKMGQMLSELGKVFVVDSEDKQEKDELNVLFNKVAASVCEGCSLHKVCWEQDFYKTYRCLLDACTKLESRGAVEEQDFDSDFKKRCMRLRELSRTLNSQVEVFKLISAYDRQIEECRRLVNNQLVGLAGIVEEFSEDLTTEVFSKPDTEEMLKEKLEQKGIIIDNIRVIETNESIDEIIIGQPVCKEKRWCQSMVAPNISQILGKTYIPKTRECAFTKKDKLCTYSLVPSNNFQVQVGKAQCPKEGLNLSGDVCSAFVLSDQRYALIMSDGMGVGQEAYRESSTAVSLLEKLLSAGYSYEIAIRTVNTALFLRTGKENFVTIDVIVINQVSGLTDFIKNGGAPSLICSSRGIKVVQANTLPAGILDKIELQTFRYPVMPDNTIIMMSDGVWDAICNAGGPDGWLEDIIKQMELSNPQQVANYLLYLAIKAAGNRITDDMCVQVARIEQTEIA